MSGVFEVGPGAPPVGSTDSFHVPAAKQVSAMGGTEFMIHGFSLNAPSLP